MSAAEQALKIAPANREANRVLGIVYAAWPKRRTGGARPQRGDKADGNLRASAIKHLEDGDRRSAVGEAGSECARDAGAPVLRSGAFEKAIPLLIDLVNQEPGWQDGPLLLAEAYAGAGRIADAIAWLEERVGRRSAAAADARRLLRAPAALDGRGRRLRRGAAAGAAQHRLKTRYASALLNAGGRDEIEQGARRADRA